MKIGKSIYPYSVVAPTFILQHKPSEELLIAHVMRINTDLNSNQTSIYLDLEGENPEVVYSGVTLKVERLSDSSLKVLDTDYFAVIGLL